MKKLPETKLVGSLSIGIGSIENLVIEAEGTASTSENEYEDAQLLSQVEADRITPQRVDKEQSRSAILINDLDVTLSNDPLLVLKQASQVIKDNSMIVTCLRCNRLAKLLILAPKTTRWTLASQIVTTMSPYLEQA